MRTRTPTEWQVSGPNYFARCREIRMEPVMSVIDDGPIPVPSQWEVVGWFRLDRPMEFITTIIDIGDYIPALKGKAVLREARQVKARGKTTTTYQFVGDGAVTRVSGQ